MICTQPIPQLQFINTQAATICPNDLTQISPHSNCCKASSNSCGTSIFPSAWTELHNSYTQLNNSWLVEHAVPPPSDYNQMNPGHQESWGMDDATPSSLSDQPNTTPSDHGLGISTDGSDYIVTEISINDGGDPFLFDQKTLYPPQQVDDHLLASPIFQIPQSSSTGGNGAYYCGTPNAANSTFQTPSSQYNTPFQVNEYSFQQPFLSPAYRSDMATSSVQREGNMFSHPMNRQYSTMSETPQTTAHPWDTPMVQSSPTPWLMQLPTPECSDGTYSRNSLQLPQKALDFSTEYSAHEDTNRQQQQQQQQQQPLRTIMTVPIRRKPHLRPSLSESCVPRLSSPARVRAASTSHFLHPPQHDYNVGNAIVPQLPLPALLPSMLINASPTQMPIGSVPTTPNPSYRLARNYSHAHPQQSQPSSPPESDFIQPNAFSMRPIRQDPTFAGDIYTPQWRRRTPNGRWEGFCGYCKPGRWLDLKNSRYWEDKLRNHGICAKTKQHFVDPIQIRWVNADGTVIAANGIDLLGRQLENAKREGLCGTCQNWITMDGARTKAFDRPTGWYTHAYKCHNHSERNNGIQPPQTV